MYPRRLPLRLPPPPVFPNLRIRDLFRSHLFLRLVSSLFGLHLRCDCGFRGHMAGLDFVLDGGQEEFGFRGQGLGEW